MSLGELIIWVSIAGMGRWALYRIGRAMRRDRDWSSQLEGLAEAKDLVPRKVDRGPGVHELKSAITWRLVKSWWSRNPSMDLPPSGSTVFTGQSNGLSISVDTVLVRKYWSNLYDEYLRIAVELPGFPRSLTMRPKGRISRIARLVGLKRVNRGAHCLSNLTVVFSSDPSDRDLEQGYLSTKRLRVLEEFEKRFGGVYIHDGMVFLVKHRRDKNKFNLNALYDNTILLVTRLVEAG